MNYPKTSLIMTAVLFSVGLVFILAWQNTVRFASYSDIKTALQTTTATFGTLLGIITAGLMFTQGKFSELASELSEKSPIYLRDILSLERIQLIGTRLVRLHTTFAQLARDTAVAEERALYERISTKSSSMFASVAVLSNLKLKQEGVPDTGLLVSEMDLKSHEVYERARKSIKKEWQVFDLIQQIIDAWESATAFSNAGPNMRLALQADLKSSVAILKVKEGIDANLKRIRSEVTKTLDELNDGLGEISKKLHDDAIPQLLFQMKQANAIRGKYFYSALVFIAAPLLINLLILPQLSESTAVLFQPLVLLTSLLSVMGVIFLLLYAQKILNV